ncbi:hypothetical protein GCM10022243_51930 [Saccharothrix violaceirubra]|uniref:ESAT-6 protein secretion system EspG family protein n=1 Tax=Saccharothrix violaceirubra TaxID=413306 RepID=A0A7W7TAK3_9PSEU|nr:ESX secretion-associated protein EspG [Saccharothrix violaceirubra]MBB4969506.1 hypothetical protein [Saccharothrix violaceirubra]
MTNATLSAAQFRTAWEHLDLGALPIVLHVPDDPAPWSELVENDLVRDGDLDPWLGSALELVARPPRAVDLRLGIGSVAVRALAVSGERGAVLAVLSGGRLSVRDPDADLPAAVVSVLPADGDLVGAQDLHGRIGAAVLDATGRRCRSRDVVDFHGPVPADGLRERVASLLARLSG